MKFPVKWRALFEKDMLEKRCALVKSYSDAWKKYYILRTLSCHTTRNIMSSV